MGMHKKCGFIIFTFQNVDFDWITDCIPGIVLLNDDFQET